MPDIQNNPYNYNQELQDTGVINTQSPSIAPIQEEVAASAPVVPNIFNIMNNSDALVKAQNPWMKSEQYNTPVNTKLSDTERYADPQYGFNPYNVNTETQYGDREGWFKTMGKDAVKIGANVIAGFAQTIATIPNAVNAVISGDFSKLEDNPVNNTTSDLLASLDKAMPQFQNTFANNHPIANYIPFYGNGWGSVMQNVAFVGGAILATVLQDAAVGAITVGAGDAPLIAAQIGEYGTKLGKMFTGGKEAFEAFNEALNAGDNTAKALNRAYTIAKISDGTKYALALQTAAWSQAAMMSNSTHKMLRTELQQDYYDKHGYDAIGLDNQKIEDYARDGSNAQMLATGALLTVTDAIQFPSLLKPFQAAKRGVMATLDNGVNIGLKEGQRDIYEAIVNPAKGIKGLASKVLPSTGLVTSIGTQTAQMGGLMFFGRTAEDFYKRKFDDSSISDLDNLNKSAATGLQKVFFTREGREGVLMGGLIGIAIHGLRTAAERLRGLPNSKDAITNTTLSLLNSTTLTGTLENHYDEAATTVSIQKDMKSALESGDLFEYKNLQQQQLYNLVSSGVKANRFESRIEQLKLLKELSPDDFKSTFQMDFNDGTKATSNDYVDALIDKAYKIRDIVKKVDRVFENPYDFKSTDPKEQDNFKAFEYYKEQLGMDLSEKDDNKARIAQLGLEIGSVAPEINLDKLVNLTSEEGVNQTIKDFQSRVKELNKDQELGIPSKRESNFLESKIESLQSDLKDFQPARYMRILHDTIGYLSGAEDVTAQPKENLISPIDLPSVLQKAQDIYKLGENSKRADKHYEILTSKNGYESFINEIISKFNVAGDNLTLDKDGNIKDERTVVPDGAVEDVSDLDENGNPIEPQAQPEQPAAQPVEDIVAQQKEKGILTHIAKVKSKKDLNPDAVDYIRKVLKAEPDKNSLKLIKEAAKNKQKDLQDAQDAEDAKNSGVELSTGTTEKKEPKSTIQKVKEAVKTSSQAAVNKAKALASKVYDTFNPQNFLNKVNSRTYEDTPRYDDNLRSVLFDGKPEDLQNSSLKVSKNNHHVPEKASALNIPGLENVVRKTSPINIEISINDKPIGKLADANSLFFKRDGALVPLSEVTKEEYPKITGNAASTYVPFMKELNGYKAIYDKLRAEYEGGKTEFKPEDVKDLFDLIPNYGKPVYTDNISSATPLKNIKTRNEGDVVLSVPTEYDANSKSYVRTNKPSILGVKDLSPDNFIKLQNFLTHDIIEKIKGLNSRYIYINQLPNGKYDEAGIFAARPAKVKQEVLDNIVNTLTHLPDKIDKETLKGINKTLRDEVYIADSNNDKGTKTNIKLSVNEDGQVSLNLINKGKEVSKALRFSREELSQAKDIQGLVDIFNQKIRGKEGIGGFSKLNIKLSKDDFKTNILADDEEGLNPSTLGEQLTVATNPQPYNNYSVKVLPKGGQSNEETGIPKTEKEFNVNKMIAKLKKPFKIEYNGEALTEQQTRRLQASNPIFDVNGKLDAKYLADTLRITLPGAVKIADALGNIKDQETLKSKPRPQLTAKEHEIIDEIESSDTIPDTVKAMADIDPKGTIQYLQQQEAGLTADNKPATTQGTVAKIVETKLIPQAKEGDKVTVNGTEWIFQRSKTVSKKGEKAEPTWQFKDSRGTWSNAGKSNLIEINEALQPKEEPIFKTEEKTKDILDEVTDKKIGEKKVNYFNINFPDKARAFGTIENNVASLTGIEAAKVGEGLERQKGTKVYERTIDELSNNGITTLKVSNQSEDSRIVLEKLVEKGILTNPRGEVGSSGNEHPTTFDIAKKEVPKIEENKSILPDTLRAKLAEVKKIEEPLKVEKTSTIPEGAVTYEQTGGFAPVSLLVDNDIKNNYDFDAEAKRISSHPPEFDSYDYLHSFAYENRERTPITIDLRGLTEEEIQDKIKYFKEANKIRVAKAGSNPLEVAKKALEEFNAKDRWMKPIPADSYSLYGHLSDIQKAFIAHDYDKLISEGKMTEQQLRDIVASSKRITTDELGRVADSEKGLSSDLVDQVMFRVNHPELLDDVEYWKTIPNKDAKGDLPSDYIRTISEAVKSGDMLKAIESGMLSPEDARKILDATAKNPKVIGILIENKLKELNSQKKELKTTEKQAAKEEPQQEVAKPIEIKSEGIDTVMPKKEARVSDNKVDTTLDIMYVEKYVFGRKAGGDYPIPNSKEDLIKDLKDYKIDLNKSILKNPIPILKNQVKTIENLIGDLQENRLDFDNILEKIKSLNEKQNEGNNVEDIPFEEVIKEEPKLPAPEVNQEVAKTEETPIEGVKKKSISAKMSESVKKLIPDYEDGDLSLYKAADKIDSLFEKNEQGIKDNFPEEYKKMQGLLDKRNNIERKEPIDVKSLPDAIDTVEKGSTVIYNGQEVVVDDVEKVGDNTYYLIGDHFVKPEDVTLPEKDSDLLETYNQAIDDAAAKNVFNTNEDGTPYYDQLISEDSPEVDDSRFTYVGLHTVLERLKNKFGLDYKVVDAEGNWRGHFKDGQVLINLKNVNKDTPFHEYLHPFIETAKTGNPELYNKLHELLAEDPEGQIELKVAKIFYKNETEQDQKDEALVTYLSKKMSDSYSASTGKRIESTFFEKVKDLIGKFRTWMARVIWGYDPSKERGKEERQKQVLTLRGMRIQDFSLEGSYRPNVGKGEKISTQKTNFIEQMTLNDFANFVGVTDVKFDLTNNLDVINNMDRLQKATFDPETKDGKILNRIENRLGALVDTANKRRPSEELRAEAAAVRGILTQAQADEGLSINNYMKQGINAISFANDEFGRIQHALHIPDAKFSKKDIIDLNRRLQVANDLYSFYNDVEPIFRRVAKGLKDEDYRNMSEVFSRNKEKKDSMRFVLADLTSKWLYPYIESANKEVSDVDKARHPELLVQSEKDFKNKLLTADADLGLVNYLFSSIGSSKDPVNAIVKTALIDILRSNHDKSNRIASDMEEEYHNFLKRTGMKNDRKQVSDYVLKNYSRHAEQWEKTGEDKDGLPEYGYVKRLAFHEEFNQDQFDKAKRSFITSLGEEPDSGDKAKHDAWADKIFNWDDSNMVTRNLGKDSEGLPIVEHIPSDKYRNADFDKLKSDPFYQKMYNQYKEDNSNVLENKLNYGIFPQVSKGENSWTDLKWEGLGKTSKTILGKIADKFRGNEASFQLKTEDGEINFGNDDINLDGSTYKSIKHAYTRLLDEKDLDTVLIESVLKYHHASQMFSDLKEAEPNIKALQDLINGNEALGFKGRGVELRTANGNVIFDKVLKLPQLKEKALVRLNEQLNAFVNDVVYGDAEYQSNLRIGNYTLSLNKLGSNLGLLTALNNMAFNVGGGMGNVLIGDYQSLMEGFGGKYYNKKEWAASNGEYWGNIKNIFNDVTSVKKSEITQIIRHYDMLQGEFRDKFGKNIVGSIAQRFSNLDTIFVFMHGGEHHIQTTMGLSMMRHQMVETADGKMISLRDAYSLDKNGNLRLRDGVKWTKEDDDNFMGRMHSKNYELNGNYSSLDKSMAQRRWYGKAALLYKKYLYNAFRARYSDTRMDYELRDMIRGNYNTFFSKLASDIHEYKFDAARRFLTRDGWNEEEKYAYNKTVFELSSAIGITALCIGIQAGADKSTASWGEKAFYLRLLNLQNDLTQYTIFGLPDMVRIAHNPSAIMGTLGKYGDFFAQLVTDPTGVYKQKQGIFPKGYNKAAAKGMKALPFARQVVNLAGPDGQIKFYEMNPTK